jgi:putative hydrolase of the HAD superfamily
MKLDWIAFDADDTLWQNEEIYREGREKFLEIMAKYSVQDRAEEAVDQVELENLPHYGYGVMSFILSLIETAVEITEEDFRGKDVRALLELGKEMLTAPPQVFAGVPEVLKELQSHYPLMLITKGDLFHQQRKVNASGLGEYFRVVEVVSRKTVPVYRDLLNRHRVAPDQFLMVGNSVRSDIQPVAALGGWALHVKDHLSWSHEQGALSPEEQARVFEVGRIDQVGGVIHRLTQAGNPAG